MNTWGVLDITQYNILSYGADNTGSRYSDDAITLIKNLIEDGEKIIFPKGSYKFAKEIVMDKDVEIDFCNSTFSFDSINGFIFKGKLKTSKTVVTNYRESVSKNSIVLSNVKDVSVGDLINILSTEPFNPARDYYYKGGNAIVTNIKGNIVYFSLTLPFDIDARTITVNVYKPIKLILKNIGMIKGTNQDVSKHLYGLRVEYGANCMISYVNTDNFRYNVDLYGCVNADLSFIKTGHAKDASVNNTENNYDGYGVAVENCTNITLNHVYTRSGQHGLTTTGKEPNFNIIANSCTFKSETGPLGLGHHENIIDMTLNNCTIFGFVVYGNTTFNYCRVLDSELGSEGKIGLSDNPRFANYVFNGGTIEPTVTSRDYSFNYSEHIKYIGNVIFNGCEKVKLFTQVKLGSIDNGKVGVLNYVSFKNCNKYRFNTMDKVKKLVIEDSVAFGLDNPNITQALANNTYEKIDEIHLIRTKSTKRYRDIYLLNVGKLFIDSLSFTNDSEGINAGSFEVSGIDELVVKNTDMTNAERGFTLLSAIQTINIRNSSIKTYTSDVLKNAILGAANVNISGMKNVSSGLFENYLTATDGKKYSSSINSSGVYVLTAVV